MNSINVNVNDDYFCESDHEDMREEWVNELRDKKKVTTVKVSTDKNIVDMMTKCLSA